MATEFAPAVQAFPRTNGFDQPYKNTVQYTQDINPFNQPGSGQTTPNNVSPTSPQSRSSASIRQMNAYPHMPLYGRRQQPLYVPAALRPTEKPVRSSPPKNTSSAPESPTIYRGHRRGTEASFDSGISRVVSEDLAETTQGPVSGPPSRNHWKPDSSVTVCAHPSCNTAFSLFNRRHHCRRCGDIFCHVHSSHQVRLSQHALFHPDANYYRACDRCWGAYRDWEVQRVSRSNSQSSQCTGAINISVPGSSVPENAVDSPMTDQVADTNGHLKAPHQQLKVGSVAASAPGNWHWSTF